MNKAEELIACLEGEIAKRDARIVELEKELQAGATAVENCELFRAMLAAAQAAPAADAGMVEALEKLARLGNGDKYGNSEGNFIAQAALAAHRAKEVV